MITEKYLTAKIHEIDAAIAKHRADITANEGASQFCKILLMDLEQERVDREREEEAAAALQTEKDAVLVDEEPGPNGEDLTADPSK